MAKKSKDLQQDVTETAHRIWLAGLGALSMAEEEGNKLFKNLVERGEGIETRGREQVEKAKGAVVGVRTVAESYWETFEKRVDEKVTAVIHRIGVPTKDEIQTLTSKVEELTRSIESLRRKEAAKETKKASTPATT